MEEGRRTRSQGPLSISEDSELIQCGSLPNPVRIEREHAEACRQASRQASRATRVGENMVESSEILQAISTQPQYSEQTPQRVKISPNQQE